MPIDSDAQSRNLLKMPTASGALVLVLGNELSPPAPFPPHRTILNRSILTQDRLKLCSIYACMFDGSMCLHKACRGLSEFLLSTV